MHGAHLFFLLGSFHSHFALGRRLLRKTSAFKSGAKGDHRRIQVFVRLVSFSFLILMSGENTAQTGSLFTSRLFPLGIFDSTPS